MSDPKKIKLNIPLAEPYLGGKEWEYVKECLDSGWISSVGPFVGRFEEKIKERVDASFAVCVMNGTAALHTALLAVGVRSGEEVLVSDLTFVAPVNAIHYCNAHPVLIDADPKTWQIDAGKLERFLSEESVLREGVCRNKKTNRRIAAILPVHILGFACEIDRICALAQKYRLKVVEDACEGIGVCYRGKHLGTFGDIGVFSFNGNKIITTGGGGVLVTAKKEVADKAHYLTTQAKDDPLEYFHAEVGYNYRLTNVQAAIGLAQLEQLDQMIAAKRRIAAYYQEALRPFEKLSFPEKVSGTEPTHWLPTLLLEKEKTIDDRKKIIRRLNDEGIGARPLWHTIHDLPPYREAQAFAIEHSGRIYERGISLPSSPQLTPADLRKVVEVFGSAYLSA